MNHSESIQHWMKCLLMKRYGGEWEITPNKDSLELTIREVQDKKIVIKSNEKFYGTKKIMDCGEWVPETEGFINPLGMPLIMPGQKNVFGKLIKKNDATVFLDYDVLGLAYWSLTRVEELYDQNNLDSHSRFDYKNSHAFQFKYIDRPIVDEWFAILKQIIEIVFPSFNFIKKFPCLKISCDIDRPFKNKISLSALPRRIGGDLIRRKSPIDAIHTLKHAFFPSLHDFNSDPWYQNIIWIMDINERYGNKVQFNFISGGSHQLDADYQVTSVIIKNLMALIVDRGHEIGLHPSYNTYNNPAQLKIECDNLINALNEQDIKVTELKSRQHYLRWSSSFTPKYLDDSGISEDSTLGYSSNAGFRAGTSIKFQMFDHENKKTLKIQESPLVVMESTVIAKTGYSELSLSEIVNLSNRSKIMNGDFTLLWHNSDFEGKQSKMFYVDLLEGL